MSRNVDSSKPAQITPKTIGVVQGALDEGAPIDRVAEHHDVEPVVVVEERDRGHDEALQAGQLAAQELTLGVGERPQILSEKRCLALNRTWLRKC